VAEAGHASSGGGGGGHSGDTWWASLNSFFCGNERRLQGGVLFKSARTASTTSGALGFTSQLPLVYDCITTWGMMRHKVLAVFLLCTIAASASPLLLVTDHPDNVTRPDITLRLKSDKHQCCTVGHNRALPKEVAIFSHSGSTALRELRWCALISVQSSIARIFRSPSLTLSVHLYAFNSQLICVFALSRMWAQSLTHFLIVG
jgi:hypothetical protein